MKRLKNKHEVICASNSVEAVSVLKSRSIDLVITEVDIGEVDGWRLSRFIRTGILAISQDAPILLVTENHSERIAETTARMFDINQVISFQELPLINSVITILRCCPTFNTALYFIYCIYAHY